MLTYAKFIGPYSKKFSDMARSNNFYLYFLPDDVDLTVCKRECLGVVWKAFARENQDLIVSIQQRTRTARNDHRIAPDLSSEYAREGLFPLFYEAYVKLSELGASDADLLV